MRSFSHVFTLFLLAGCPSGQQECESRKDQAGTWCSISSSCADGSECPEALCASDPDGKTEWCSGTDVPNEPVVCVAPGAPCR